MKRPPRQPLGGVDVRGLRALARRIAARREQLGPAFDADAPARVYADLRLSGLAHPATLLEQAQRGDRGARRLLAKMTHDNLVVNWPLTPELREFVVWALRQPDANQALGRNKQGRGRDAWGERQDKWMKAAVVAFLVIEYADELRAYREAARLLGYRSVRALQAACQGPLATQRQLYQHRPDAAQMSAILATAEEMVGLLLADHEMQR
jgi:hypothetical protein